MLYFVSRYFSFHIYISFYIVFVSEKKVWVFSFGWIRAAPPESPLSHSLKTLHRFRKDRDEDGDEDGDEDSEEDGEDI